MNKQSRNPQPEVPAVSQTDESKNLRIRSNLKAGSQQTPTTGAGLPRIPSLLDPLIG